MTLSMVHRLAQSTLLDEWIIGSDREPCVYFFYRYAEQATLPRTYALSVHRLATYVTRSVETG